VNVERSGENRWAAAFYLTYPVELFLVSFAQLLVLHRILRLSSITKQPWWPSARQIYLSVFAVLNAIGIVGNCVAGYYFIQAAEFGNQAADAWKSNSVAAARAYELQAQQSKAAAGSSASVQRFCEMIALLLIVSAFLVVGVRCSRVISTALRSLAAAARTALSLRGYASSKCQQAISEASIQGRSLQRKIVVTYMFVFVTVFLRSVFSVVFAAALAFQDMRKGCSTNPCDACYNTYSHITFWILYFPLFQQFIMLVSSPLSLLVALWGMSGGEVLEEMDFPALRSLPL
jgi:hypothetical protein